MARVLPAEHQWDKLAEAARYNARTLATLCNLCPRQLLRQFQSAVGQSPQRWLNELRLMKAQETLLLGLTVKEVASDLGFKQLSHFCR